ncbi:Nif3-like dinuclear metal center hexameric protein [Actinoplanes sp. TFC3]|uniref:Nif3-like dinuclear metal center hexameric protein n=1 Tax=Actinoplanes sp. TFC3 TaxID=1710355 RepID=UPI0009E7F976|nr:Nif3-like dinuclear metal center hexameric protein [Actinoplanes sp. TFC3]
MTDSAITPPTVREAVAALDARYPRSWAEQWDRVGPVLGDFDRPVRTVLGVVDVVPETVEEAVAVGADLIVAHHPLLLKGVSSVAPDTYKGRIVHRLIKAGIALYVAHTNADVANPGVCDALAARLGLTTLRPLVDQGEGRGIGRVGELATPLTLAELTAFVAARLPATAAGIRAAGDPGRIIRTLAVSGGAGDSFLADAGTAGADAYLCADLRHHPVSEHLAAGGPALIDVAHWASERPWLDEVAAWLRAELGVTVLVSDLDTDPWTVHSVSPDKENHP